ncbi:hypothetical protein JHK87_055707 [Glycine soja]|nr:hypothetical protein JHK87_055707 [Glycine soja]
MLRQKARIKWLKEGDNKSTYFHRLINHRRRKNAIPGIFMDDRFLEDCSSRPTLDGVYFSSLDLRDKESLVSRFNELEIKSAVWDCGGDKSPGPDGFNFNFIKHFWEILKPDIMRPISLIGCVYKIVARVLAKRLAAVLPHLIDKRQTTFMKGRHILHGVLIANETIAEAKSRSKPCMVFKADFENAYDSVSWGFLDYMLKRMGF